MTNDLPVVLVVLVNHQHLLYQVPLGDLRGHVHRVVL